MITSTSLNNATFLKHIRQTLWLCRLEACKTKKRSTKYVTNRKGIDTLKISVYPSGQMAAYATGTGNKDFTSMILKALDTQETII